MTRRPLLLFFVLAFALPWAVWGTTLAQQAGLLWWHVPESLGFWIGLPLATLGAAFLTGGWSAVRDVLLRLVRVRVGPLWYAVALLLPAALAASIVVASAVLGVPAQVGAAAPAAALLGLLLLNVWMWLLTEEAAWRGFALPRLQRRMGPLPASAVLGAIWAVWHLPLFLIAGSFQSQLPFAGFALSTIATSITIGWLFSHARGSVLLVALFHGVADVSIAFSGVMTSGPGLFWAFVGAQVVVAAAVARDLSRRPREV